MRGDRGLVSVRFITFQCSYMANIGIIRIVFVLWIRISFYLLRDGRGENGQTHSEGEAEDALFIVYSEIPWVADETRLSK